MRIVELSDRMIGGNSAYSKQSYEICTRLAKMGHSVAHIPIGRANRMGKQVYQGVLVYPSGNHPFAEDVAIDHYVDFKADMLITLKEPYLFDHIWRQAINYCLVPGSLISLGDGSLKPVEDIEVGSSLLGIHKDKVIPSVVKSRAKRYVDKVYEVMLEDGRCLYATGEHPLFVFGKGYTPIDKIISDELIPSVDKDSFDAAVMDRARGRHPQEVRGALQRLPTKRKIPADPINSVDTSEETEVGNTAQHITDGREWNDACQVFEDGTGISGRLHRWRGQPHHFHESQAQATSQEPASLFATAYALDLQHRQGSHGLAGPAFRRQTLVGEKTSWLETMLHSAVPRLQDAPPAGEVEALPESQETTMHAPHPVHQEEVTHGLRFPIRRRGRGHIRTGEETSEFQASIEASRIASIIPKEYHGFVYDLTTETNNFLANGFLAHNCPFAVIDHSPVTPMITSRLHTAFRVLALSRFGQRELRREGIDSVYMPHAVRTDLYRPLEDRAACRKAFYLDPDEYVVGIVAMNRARKMIPRMLRGYKRFREMNPDVKSHMMIWTNINPSRYPEETSQGISDVGVSLLPEIMGLGLGEAVRWPKWEEVESIGGIPEWDQTGGWDMVKLYNCFDVLLLCSGGEGFGLPLIESQACGVPVVTTDYAAGPELVGAGLTVPWSDYVVYNTAGTRTVLADVDKMGEALTKIMNADREKLARRARSFAERYSWENVLKQYWEPFLEEAETELRPLIRKEGTSHW